MVLSYRVMFSYSSVAFTAELMSTFWGLYALHFLTDNAGLQPLYTGILIVIYRTWDAINDIWFGYLSDNTVSKRWGKRRGWMLGGALPYAMTYSIFWYVPFVDRGTLSDQLSPENQQLVLFFWFLFLLITIDAGFSAVNVAYLALLGDLTENPVEKYSVSLLRSIFIGLGSLISVALAGVISYQPIEDALFGGEHLRGWAYLSLFFCILYVFTIVDCVYQTSGLSVIQHAKTPHPGGIKHFFSTFKRILRLKTVRLAVIIFVTTVTTVQFSIACLAYFFLDLLDSGEFTMAMVILVALGFATVTAIIIKTCFIHAEKRTTLRLGLIIWMSFYVVLAFIHSPGWYMYPAAALMGVGLGVSIVIPLALMTDTADIVEHQIAERHDGIMFGMLQFFNKLLLGFLIMGFQFSLQFTGFVKNEPLPSATQWAIRGGLMLPVVLLAITYWANAEISISNEDLKRISSDLTARREKLAKELISKP